MSSALEIKGEMHADLTGENPGYYSAVLSVIQIETMSTYYQVTDKCFRCKAVFF